MAKQNCWEFKKCGREPAGVKAAELGVCPVALEIRIDKINGGKNAGRACWAVSGTLCGGKVQGAFAAKVGNCMVCEFFKLVVREEGAQYVGVTEILTKLKQL
ncbi:MAG: hypothetical protein WDL87_04195 [Candidatus Omnitrophota bacterium]|jgi:hypothetical protein